MKLATQSKHLDWLIITVVGYDNLDDWKPGDPDRYYVTGTATLPLGDAGATYSTDQPQIVRTDHFTDERLARRYHGEATAKLQQMINKLKTD